MIDKRRVAVDVQKLIAEWKALAEEMARLSEEIAESLSHQGLLDEEKYVRCIRDIPKELDRIYKEIRKAQGR